MQSVLKTRLSSRWRFIPNQIIIARVVPIGTVRPVSVAVDENISRKNKFPAAPRRPLTAENALDDIIIIDAVHVVGAFKRKRKD